VAFNKRQLFDFSYLNVNATQFVCVRFFLFFIVLSCHNLQGESAVAEMWQQSGLEWSLFVPATEVQTFLHDRKLHWLDKVSVSVHAFVCCTFCVRRRA